MHGKGIEVDGWFLCIVEKEETGVFIEDVGNSWIIEYPGGILKEVSKDDMIKSFMGWYTHKSNIQIEQLSRKETQDLEINGTSYLNFFHKEMDSDENFSITDTFVFYDWCSAPSLGLKKGVEYLKDILGNPTYHKNYKYRNAIWGLKIDGEPLVFYYCNGGPTFTVSKNCSNVIKLYKTLTRLLNKGE